MTDDVDAAAQEEWLARWREGPRRLRWERVPVQVGDAAPDLVLPDQDGRPVRLSEAWARGPLLLLFWRQFGCGCGLDRAQRLRKEFAEYEAAGARVLIVGQGEPPRAKRYAEKYALPCPVLCDPEERAYVAYDVLEGQPSQIMFDADEPLLRREWEAGRAFAEGRAKAGRPPVDNPWLLPAEFVLDARGVVRLAYRYQTCEDFPEPLALLAAIRACA